MYKAIDGIYEDGKIILAEPSPTTKRSKVIILFMEEIEAGSSIELGAGQTDSPNDSNE